MLPLLLTLCPPFTTSLLSLGPAFSSLILLDLSPNTRQCLDLCLEGFLIHISNHILRLGDALELGLELLDVTLGAELVRILGPILESGNIKLHRVDRNIIVARERANG